MLFRHRSAGRSQNPLNRCALGLEPLESRQLLAGDFQLFKDINATPAPVGIFAGMGSPAGDSLVIGGTFFFTAIDGVHGQELWKSDGTEAGTVLVKDIRPGAVSSFPYEFCELNGILYFSANDGVTGGELWRSDGTEEGTFVVRDSSPGDSGVYPQNLHRVGEMIVFESRTGWIDAHLWKSDGTEAGTTEISKLGPDTWPTIFGQNSTSLLLLNNDALWRTDGTEEGTFLLLPWMGNAGYIGAVGETIYLTRQMPGSPKTFWKTDGTVAGTAQVGSISVGSSWSSGFNRVAIGQTLLFSANDDVHGSELWKLDGTSGALDLVKDIRPGTYPMSSYPLSSAPTDFVAVDGVAYFLVNSLNGLSISELWKSNGTSEGTVLVKQFPIAESSNGLFSLSAIDGTLYFSVKDETGNAFWKSDGTEAGTVKVKSINSGPSGSGDYRGGAGAAIRVGDSVLFFADDEHHGWELWRTDGTEAGTGLVKDIRVATADSNARQFTQVGALTYFTANDGVVGEELWVSDGTSTGTRLLKDIAVGSADGKIGHLINVDGTLYFTTGNNTTTGALWKSDGSEAGTVLVKEFVEPEFHSETRTFGNVGGALYFSMDVEGGAELWKSDGTETGTGRVAFIASNWIDRAMTEMTNVDGTLFFSANSGVGRELWKSDGTEAGTVLVKDIFPGGSWWGYGAPYGSRPASLTEFNGQLFFAAVGPDSTYGLWRSDGTASGTVRVKGVSPTHFINLNGSLYFESSGTLWKSDGSETGTVLVADIHPTTGSGSIREMISAGDKIYVVNNYYPVEEGVLWVSDGTAAGTMQLGGGSISAEFTSPTNLIEWDGELYFMAHNNLYGMELWRSDGTVSGTAMVQDFNEDYTASLGASNSMGLINGRLAVVAKTLDYGREMWISPVEAVSTPGDYDASGGVDGADFLTWQRGFGAAATPAGSGADGDGSGAVDAGDLGVWAEHFGEGSLGGVVAAGEDEALAAEAGALEGVAAVDRLVDKPRAADSRSLIALAQGAFGIEGSRERSGAKAIVRADDAEEIPHVRAKRASSRDAALASLADWSLETQRSWSLGRERLMEFDGDEESPLEFNWQLVQDSGRTPS